MSEVTKTSDLKKFNQDGAKIYNALKEYSLFADNVLNSQPPIGAGYLDEMSSYLQDIQSLAALSAEQSGRAEAFEASLMFHFIKFNCNEPEFKAIKNSSTLVTNYVKGRYPLATALVSRIKTLEKVIFETFYTYRTAISAYKNERSTAEHTKLPNNQ